MSLKGVAQETLNVLDEGCYTAPSGALVSIADAQAAAVAGTQLYTPEALAALLAEPGPGGAAPAITVTDERTQEACRRLFQDEGVDDVLALNFASARNPGGGFLRGAKAQEEDLSRCSGLYPSLITQMRYYTANRVQSSLLYTDHMIYSPQVPFFRVRSRTFIEQPYLASVITAPAPNAGEHLRREPGATAALDEAVQRRAGMVLALARAHGHRNLVLGAWGCGVFRNDPTRVAEVFRDWLNSRTFAGCFDQVVFAILATTKPGKRNLEAFQAVLG
ncbi:MAG: TIGR02452 family protein [Alphaproteobacteria bacterium]|nr:TIGR02452 family protein [Alphaproteobacteria bacterium]